MATIAAVFPTSAMLDRVPSRDHFAQVTSMRGLDTPIHLEEHAPPSKRQRTDDGTSTDDEDAAELLLGMGIAVVAPPAASPTDSHDSDYSPRPARRRSDYVCMQCLGPVTVSGERRPTFVCTHCRSKTGYSKRAHKALLAADLRVEVTAYEAAHRVRAGSPQQDSGASSRDTAAPAVAADVEQDTEEAVGLQGRCKCGKRIAPDHPPCKSELMLLCERFQQRFGTPTADGRPQQIMLKTAVAQLGVSRRRLYDIINVLEAVEIVARTGKLTYEWRGLSHLDSLLERFAEDEALGLPVEERARRAPAPPEPPRADSKTPHTLWALSRKFVRVLLTRRGPMPLADVAQLLIGNGVAEARRSQTQITIERRLYDIGSILTAVGLIQKTYLGRRQPAFMWTYKRPAAVGVATTKHPMSSPPASPEQAEAPPPAASVPPNAAAAAAAIWAAGMGCWPPAMPVMLPGQTVPMFLPLWSAPPPPPLCGEDKAGTEEEEGNGLATGDGVHGVAAAGGGDAPLSEAA